MKRMETAALGDALRRPGLFVLAGVLTGYLPVSHLARLEY